MSIETDALEALTHDPTKVLKGVVSLLRWLSTRNDAKALAEFREAMDNQVVLNAQGIEKLATTREQRLAEMERVVERLVEMVVRPEDWKGHPEHVKPTEGDIVTRAEQFALAVLKAGPHGKKKILWNAFFSSFNPEFYREGWSTHLWDITKQLEYPECRMLADRIREIDAKKRKPAEKEALTHLRVKRFLARYLESLGLVGMVEISTSVTRLDVTEVGRMLHYFVWDEEMWRDEKPQQ